MELKVNFSLSEELKNQIDGKVQSAIALLEDRDYRERTHNISTSYIGNISVKIKLPSSDPLDGVILAEISKYAKHNNTTNEDCSILYSVGEAYRASYEDMSEDCHDSNDTVSLEVCSIQMSSIINIERTLDDLYSREFNHNGSVTFYYNNILDSNYGRKCLIAAIKMAHNRISKIYRQRVIFATITEGDILYGWMRNDDRIGSLCFNFVICKNDENVLATLKR